ncbi:MAG: MerR family DNA-binding protein [Polyangiales bacterium]
MRVGELAKSAGVSGDTIRLYESMGLLRATRGRNGYREFPEEARTLVALIRQAQRLGFSLSEIGAVLRGLSGGLSAAEVEALLTRKLADIDRQLEDLQALRGLLETRLRDVCALGLGPAPSGAGKRAAKRR